MELCIAIAEAVERLLPVSVKVLRPPGFAFRKASDPRTVQTSEERRLLLLQLEKICDVASLCLC